MGGSVQITGSILPIVYVAALLKSRDFEFDGGALNSMRAEAIDESPAIATQAPNEGIPK
jgi:hypothetical protein